MARPVTRDVVRRDLTVPRHQGEILKLRLRHEHPIKGIRVVRGRARLGPGHSTAFLGLVGRYALRGNLVTGAQLAALAGEHGLAVYSADTHFARYAVVTWVKPIAA